MQKTRIHSSRFRRFLRSLYTYKGLLLMMLPAIVFFAVFRYAPMYGVTVAFKDFKVKKGILGSPWADPATKYFIRMFNNPSFMRAFKNTLVISILKILFTFPAPIIFAIMLNEVRNTAFKKTIQTVTYLPHFMSWIVVAGLMRVLLSPVDGVINDIIVALGGNKIRFLMEPKWFRPLVVLSSLWKNVGWGSIVYLAALTGIDPQLYEAADIDGASGMQKILHVTLPCIFPTISIMFILRIGDIMSGGFDQIVNLYNSLTYSVGDILDTYAYRVGLVDFDYSLSTALSLFKNVIGLIMVLITNYVTKKLGQEGVY
jgi:putative aldouronate transport system permease protein